MPKGGYSSAQRSKRRIKEIRLTDEKFDEILAQLSRERAEQKTIINSITTEAPKTQTLPEVPSIKGERE